MITRLIQWINREETSASQDKEQSDMRDSQEALIDQSTLTQIIADTSEEVLPLLIDSYIEESNDRMQRIIRAVEHSDFQSLEFEAHTLAGTSLAMGATILGRLAKQIEQNCLQHQFDDATKRCAELQTLCHQSLAALHAYKDKPLD